MRDGESCCFVFPSSLSLSLFPRSDIYSVRIYLSRQRLHTTREGGNQHGDWQPTNQTATGNRDQNIQVNVLSTTLLAILLLPWLKAERANRSSPAHISIVGSGTHIATNPRTWDDYITKDGGVLAHFRDPKNWPGPDSMYTTTKMMVHYAAAELAKLAKGKNNRYVPATLALFSLFFSFS